MPRRWHGLRPHPVQARLWNDGKRFAVVPAGRRSGKTELAKRRLIAALPQRKDWQDPRYFAAAPTREQAKRIFWQDLRALTPERWVKRVYGADLCVRTVFGSELWVLGMDRPERMEGTPWDGGVLDEFANMRPEAWGEHIRPALSDRAGWCWLIGVPEGLNHFKELSDYAASGKDPDWAMYTWPSSEILPPEEVASARRVLDERTFRQEYEASFEGANSRAYYPYRRERHEDAAIELSEDLRLILCCDFNVDPCVWEVAQVDAGKVLVVAEIAKRGTSTIEMAREFAARYGRHRAGITVYGDAAGMQRSTAGKSDYALLHEMGLKEQRIRRANPPVRDRVNAVCAMLENASGDVRLFHRPECEYLRKDFETVEWRDGGAELDKSRRDRTHATDALGYFIESEFPLRAGRYDGTMRFYK